jgi:uncharacterized protein (DUF1015 family)
VWRVREPDALVEAFGRVPAAYVADGHHRSASAVRVAQARRHLGKGEHEWFPAAIVPAVQLHILPYNRLVKDLGGRTPEAIRVELARVGRMTPDVGPTPPGPGRFAIYLGGRWDLLELPPGPADDPVRSLDVWRLQARVLEPVFGITDQRTDPRIDFVGGRDGAATLAARVDAGQAALAISLHPASMAELMAVADAGAIMPPKSTWFEPKLASGFFVHRFE